MKTLWTLTISAIKMFVRNKQALFFTFFFPLFLMTVLGLINFDKPVNIDIGVVVNGTANDGTQKFIDSLSQVPYFTVHTGTGAAERQSLIDDKRATVFVIPGNLIPGPNKV